MKRSPYLWMISLFFFGLSCFNLSAQQTIAPTWKLLKSPGRLLKADEATTDKDGWTHFYNAKENILLLSVQTQGQDIGDITDRLSISTGLLANYGKGANDLSGADYIKKAIWLTMNRYWRIQHANPIYQPVRVRFYFDTQDFADLQSGMVQTGQQLADVQNIQFYTLEGKSVHPFSTRTQDSRASFRFHEGQQLSIGQEGELYYAEYLLNDLACSGSGGILIPLSGKSFSIAGQILDPKGTPLEDIYIRSAVEGAVVRTTESGEYTLANLQAGNRYDIAPFSQAAPSQHVTVLDLIALQKHLQGTQVLTAPYQLLAADLDRSGRVDEQDLELMHNLIIGNETNFPEQRAWQFLPTNHTFANPELPLYPALPHTIRIDHLATDIQNQDFIGIKLGDLWQEADFPNEPPSLLDPSFSLGNEVVSCGGGEVLPFNLTVKGFEGIRGFQFTLEWDPEVLAFESVSNFNLLGFDERNIGAAEAEAGRLSFGWFTMENPESIRLRDGAAICSIQFRAIGGDKDETLINFSESAAPVQILRDNLSPANAYLTVGAVRIESNSAIEVTGIEVLNVSCQSDADGAIDLEVQGGTPPYVFTWSNGATTQDLTGLEPGKYFVTITDAGKCPFFSPGMEVSLPAPLSIFQENIRHIQCPGTEEGAISFKVQGGMEPYAFQWSNKARTPWITQLAAGAYAVTVTDSRGCTTEQEFEILQPEPFYLDYAISPAPINGKKGGSIAVSNLGGSTGPHTFVWSTGQTGPLNNKLVAGDYKLTITDGQGCLYRHTFSLSNGVISDEFNATLLGETFRPNALGLLMLESPKAQLVQFKVFDERSRQVIQNSIPLVEGVNYHHIQLPASPGTYLVQVLPQGNGVSSFRFSIR